MVFKIQKMLELPRSRIALVPNLALASIILVQSALVVGFCVHCIFSALPSSHETHSSGPSIGRVS